MDAKKLAMWLLIVLGIASFLPIPVALAQESSAAQQGLGDLGATSATPKINADDEEIQRKLANAGVKTDSLDARNFAKIDAETAFGDGEGPPGFIVALIMVLGALTLLAAFGVYRGARWAKPLGISVRSVDILAALPAYGAAVAAPLLAFVTVGIALSLVCIVALVRWQPHQTAKLAVA